jgi:hypothetical protein
MALGDIVIYQQASSQGGAGSRRFNVAASAAVINAGEPIALVAGSSTVIVAATNFTTITSPFVSYTVTGTGFLGIAETSSTNTASTAGKIDVMLANPGTVYLVTANSATTVSTQTKYDALVGKRVLLDLTSGSYTSLVTDSALNGFVIQPLEIAKYPGKIALTAVQDIYAF